MMKLKEYTENQVLIFIHIGRTGGGSVVTAIENEYNIEDVFNVSPLGNDENQEQNLIKAINKRETDLKCIYGHMPFGYHTHFSKTYSYFALFRDPVEQIMSQYYYFKSIHKNVTLEEYMENNKNMQVKWLLNKRNGNYCITKKDIDLAKERIKVHFSFVGITEMFEESLFLIKNKFGWEKQPYYKLISKLKRKRKKDFPNELIDKFKKDNEMEYEFYNFVKEDFIERIHSLDDKLKDELEKYKLKMTEFIENPQMIIEERLLELIDKNNRNKVVLFGASEGGNKIYDVIDKINKEFGYELIKVEAVLDNDPMKWNKELYNKKIIKPNRETMDKVDKVIISSVYKNEIFEQIMNMGIDKEKIVYISYI